MVRPVQAVPALSPISVQRAQRLAARDVPDNELRDHPSAMDVLTSLRRLASGEFPKQSRPNVQPEGITEVCGLSLGLVAGRGTGQRVCLSRSCRLLPGLTKLLCRFLRQHQPDFCFTSIQVNCGFASRAHVDRFNLGPSWIYALGDFEGGELWVEDAEVAEGDEHVCIHNILSANGAVSYRKGSSYRGRSLDVHNKWQHFDGRRLHYTKPINGVQERFSIVFYSMLRHKKATAQQRKAADSLGFRLPAPPSFTRCLRLRRTCWTCSVCSRSFPSSSRLRRHEKMHLPASHACTYPGCSYSFKRKEQLARHKWVHASKMERPYLCSFPGCGKSFADAYGLKRHMRRHEGATLLGTGAGGLNALGPHSLKRWFQGQQQGHGQ